MLKKAPNILINVRFQIIDSNNYMDLELPQHTLIKEIENIIAKRFNMNPFKIQFTFQSPLSAGILNPASTLYQNKIQNKDTIYVKFANIQTRSQAKSQQTIGQLDQKNMTLLDIISGKPQKIDSVTIGLNLVVVCPNIRCFNYNKNIIIQLGLGTFNYNYLINKLKCPSCPDKELNANPVCKIQDFIFKNCLWSLDGRSINNGIEVPYKLSQSVIVKTQDSTEFNKIINKNKWTYVNIIVKEIGKPKQKIPLLL